MATLVRHDNVSFRDQVVYTAGHAFVNCAFERCTMVIRESTGVLENCAFSNCVWHLDVLVSEREMSVAVEPIAPGDRHLFEVDDRSAMGKPMRLSLIADSAGEYRLVVRPAAGQRAAGKYALRIEELREARPEDRSRVQRTW